MRILVVSDSHGRTRGIDKAIDAVSPNMIFHLGDIERDVKYIETIYPEIELHAVLGNNDPWVRRETEKVVEVEGVNFFLTHGHLYSVYDKGFRVAKRAKELGCTIALFGHSHIPSDEMFDTVRVINPGSITLPRSGNPSCGVIEIENGHFGYALCDWF